MNLASLSVLLTFLIATSSTVESYRSANVRPAIFNRACLTRAAKAQLAQEERRGVCAKNAKEDEI
uniref:Uncharacterized protein n=1 Tax=Pristionchus pacificus TaxID=54126 RepID=A0A2A6CMW2_PRIPA|eukprot:PDM79449.1 hypothetical protein PRIPAC_32028 [Pristionchus pacificus]